MKFTKLTRNIVQKVEQEAKEAVQEIEQVSEPIVQKTENSLITNIEEILKNASESELVNLLGLLKQKQSE